MAALESTSTSTVSAGSLPDSVIDEPRLWNLSPLRDRDPAPPDYSSAGLDVYLKGDPSADADDVTVFALSDAVRNGLKRTLADDGSPALWAEPSPMTFDSWGSASGTLGVVEAPIGDADDEISLGVSATLTLANTSVFAYLLRPVVVVVGARFESAEATLVASFESTLNDGTDDTVVNFSRDLFYAYGGSTSVVLPAVSVAAGGSFQLDVDLSLVYRVAVAAAFDVAVTGAQVGFQVVEFTSLGD